MRSWAAAEGLPYPLGVSWCADEEAYNFALYSKHATIVRLLLFADDDLEAPRIEVALDPLTNKSGRVWHCRVARSVVGGCRYYGYRVDGPEPAGPFEAHAFHPEKLLLDPYARCIAFPRGFARAAALDELPNFGKAPLGMIQAYETTFDWGADRRPRHDADAVIYELHARGFTQHASSGASPDARGSFAGVIEKIAEPWDAAGTYELGRAFPGITWLQWNSRFRDDVRRFVRGADGMLGALMQRIYGSDDLFPDDVIGAYHAYQSVNHVTSHDGFTLYDLVSYERKRNAANGHDNLDGPAANWNANCGWEGDVEVPAHVTALRERQAKNLIAVLLLSNGTPMLRAGDEFLHTQGGNNNPYNQDNETGWLDWRRRDAWPGYWRFVQQMIALRKQHPSLSRSRFWRDDVRWFGSRGVVDLSSRALAFLLRGGSQGDADLYVMINGGPDPIPFVLQAPDDHWRVVVDTSRRSPDDIDPEGRQPLGRPSYVVEGRSVVVLVR